MSEPGSPQAPQVVRAINSTLPVKDGDRAQVINATGALKNHAVREALTGEVISENKDGSTTIRTDNGDLTIVLRTRDKPPEGAKVVIDLPAGSPPRQATIALAKVEQAQAQQQQQAVDAARPQPEQQQQEPDAEAPRTPPQARPLDQKTADELTRQTQQAAQASVPVNEDLPEAGDLVRLLPLPPGETVDRATTLVKLIAEQAVLDLPAVLTQTAKAPLPYGTALPPLTEEATPNILTVAQPPKLAPLLIQKTQTELVTPRELDLPPVLLFAKLAQAQIRPALENLQPFESGAKIAGALSTLTPGTVKPAGMFDVEIKGVNQPPVKIGMPGEIPAAPKIAGAQPAELPKGIAGQGSGTIAGLTPKGLPVLSVTMPGSAFPQQFVVQTGGPAGLVPGAEILFTPKPAAQAQIIPGETLPPLTTLGLPLPGAADWPALQELMATVQQAAPQAAQAMARLAPNAASPDKIPAAALLFLAAARAGDLAGWFGERSIDTLRRAGKAGLIEKLTGEIEGSARSGDRAGNVSEWRAVNLPFFHDSEAQRLALYYRHDGGGGGGGNEEDGDKKRGTRFIFDLSLNRMGAVQLDGLSRGEKLDLIVRTQAPLSQQMQMAMRRAYINALEDTGIAGEMAFQNKAEQWVRITGTRSQTSVKT